MKIKQTSMVESEVVKAIECDYCKTRYDNTLEMQEFICINTIGGYASVLGDGTKVELDLCQHCFKKLFKGIYRESECWPPYEM